MSDRILFERSTAAMLVTDVSGRVLDANEAACELLGYEPARLLALTIGELSHPDDLTPRPGAGPGAPGMQLSGRRRLRHADGSYRLIEVRARPLEDGRILSVLDLGERTGTEEDLRRYELLARHMRDIVLFVGARDGRILEANAAAERAYGYSRDELLARTVHDLRAPGSEALVQHQMAEADEHGVLFEAEHRRRDGSVFPVEVSSRGAVIGGARTLLSVVRDITERKRSEAALHEADRRKNDFLAVLSHELRNPLAPIRNSLHVLEREPGGERAGRARAVLQRQVAQLSRLIDDLLDVTRIQQGKVRLQQVPLDLGELVRRTIEDHRSVFEERAVQLQLRAWPHPLRVLGDPSRLAQVIGNLLHNAAKFTPAGGHAVVELAEDAARRRALLRVVDTGVGMSPDTIEQLFEPFAQADRSLDRSNGGLGLGLALVKRLVELHGGEVSAGSAGAGQGAEFVVTLPLAEGLPATGTGSLAAPGRPQRVLVVEDNRDAAESLREALELDGHEVAVEYSGPAGLERAHRLEPDVVLCDIGLPGMSGYDFARQLRASGIRPLLVALSGYALPADVARARESGFDAHLAKPASFEALRRVLGNQPGTPDDPGKPASPPDPEPTGGPGGTAET